MEKWLVTQQLEIRGRIISITKLDKIPVRDGLGLLVPASAQVTGLDHLLRSLPALDFSDFIYLGFSLQGFSIGSAVSESSKRSSLLPLGSFYFP